MIRGYYQGCSVVLDNETVIHNVHRFAVLGDAVLAAVIPGKPWLDYDRDNIQTVEEYGQPLRALVWDDNGYFQLSPSYSIARVLNADPVETPTKQEHHYLIAVDVRDNQPVSFALANCVISKHVTPLIQNLEAQYKISASVHHDEAIENKFLDNVRKLKSADMVVRCDGCWWPIRFVKTVETITEALESI